MFATEVSEKAALAWLRKKNGDSELLLAAAPLPWEPSALWIGRVDGRAELLAAIRRIVARASSADCHVVFHAGHDQTERIGREFASFACGRKFFISAETARAWWLKTRRTQQIRPPESHPE
jgi:hypothetical protein